MDALQEMMEIPTVDFDEVKTQISEFVNGTKGLSIAFFTNSRMGITQIHENVFRSIEKRSHVWKYSRENFDIMTTNQTLVRMMFFPAYVSLRIPQPDYIYLETGIRTGDCFGALEYRNTFIENFLLPYVNSGTKLVFFDGREHRDTTNGPQVNLLNL